MVTPVKSITTNIRQRSLVKLPSAVLEEHALGKGVPVNVTYGRNYTCVIILPPNIKISDRMLDRINILVNEPLDK